MNIGSAAKASGISAKMIRYYEQISLLPKVQRSEAGYRLYSTDDIHRLHFIKKSRELGFSLPEIADLLALWSDKSRKSSDVKKIAQKHITELENKIKKTQQMVNVLKTLTTCCAGDNRSDCPILTNLSNNEIDYTASSFSGNNNSSY